MKKLKEIEKKYGVDFGQNSNMTLVGYLKKIGYPSLAKMLTKTKKKVRAVDKTEREPLPF